MDLEMTTRAIQLIIAPAVLLTSCCIFTNGLLGLYATIGERLRVTLRERVDLLRDLESGSRSVPVAEDRLEDLDFQIPQLLHHHQMTKTSLAGTFIAMAFYILDMFVIAFSILSDRMGLYGATLAVFLVGVVAQLVGVIASLMDAYMAHKIYAFDASYALTLKKSDLKQYKV